IILEALTFGLRLVQFGVHVTEQVLLPVPHPVLRQADVILIPPDLPPGEEQSVGPVTDVLPSPVVVGVIPSVAERLRDLAGKRLGCAVQVIRDFWAVRHPFSCRARWPSIPIHPWRQYPPRDFAESPIHARRCLIHRLSTGGGKPLAGLTTRPLRCSAHPSL